MHIVYVDDDELLLEVGQAFLQASGFSVTCVNDPRQAKARAAAETPDLVLLDVRMPEMDGLQVLAELRDCPALDDTPIVFVTGLAEGKDHRRLIAAGAAGVIVKPFAPHTLHGELLQIHRRWLSAPTRAVAAR